jgi:hypothetical protein
MAVSVEHVSADEVCAEFNKRAAAQADAELSSHTSRAHLLRLKKVALDNFPDLLTQCLREAIVEAADCGASQIRVCVPMMRGWMAEYGERKSKLLENWCEDPDRISAWRKQMEVELGEKDGLSVWTTQFWNFQTDDKEKEPLLIISW